MALDTPAKIAILGAGPIGLEAALYARFLGYEVQLIEQAVPAEHVRRWGHVKMFSPFGMNCSPLGLAALFAQDPNWHPPAANALLTGQAWRDQYLLPLSQCDLLEDQLLLGRTVKHIGRGRLLKTDLVPAEDRELEPFLILTQDDQGAEQILHADAVMDTTGTFGQHAWLGSSGIPALGERACQDHIEYGLPDILNSDQERYANRRVLVLGAGFSAATSVVALSALQASFPQTQITWVVRKPVGAAGPLASLPHDPLPARAQLTEQANALAQKGRAAATSALPPERDPAASQPPLLFWDETVVESISWRADDETFSVTLNGNGPRQITVDRVIANVGYVPEAGIHAELQVQTCYATGGPLKLAARLLGESNQDCLQATAAGASLLVHPEPDFYILGAKSYGRNPHFLFAAGLRQIRDLFALLGERDTLDLYKTAQHPFAEFGREHVSA